ncbi:endolysin [Streptomyces phage Intolerant]|nr:endolysin [Streptomyces phage Intolerant]
MSGREAMVAAMESLLGLGERDGSQNKVQAWYRSRNGSAYSGNFAWCDASITWAAVQSGNYDAVCHGTDFAYTVAHAARFQAKGEWHTDIAGIQRGDIVFFDWAGTNSVGAIDHVGIVTSVSGSTVYTIEGNIGNVCARKVRYSNYIVGYGRPKYAAESKPSGSTGSGSTVKYQPFPGASWFKASPKSSIVTRMGKRLVAEKCSAYKSGPGPQWTTVDKASYQKWQKKLGYTGSDADGWPGKTSWDKLKVPVA